MIILGQQLENIAGPASGTIVLPPKTRSFTSITSPTKPLSRQRLATLSESRYRTSFTSSSFSRSLGVVVLFPILLTGACVCSRLTGV